jgi:Tol biopolymer transport system component
MVPRHRLRRRRLRAILLPVDYGGASDPVFGPAGLIAFTGDRDRPGDHQSRVWTVDHSGKRLASVGVGAEPDWSPSGALAFSSPRGLFVRYQAGSRPLRIRRTGTSPAWSPDGSRIAFSDRGDIVVTSAGGVVLRRLTSGKPQDGDPVWSPDGRQVAFVRKCEGEFDQIERVSAGGGPRYRSSASRRSTMC